MKRTIAALLVFLVSMLGLSTFSKAQDPSARKVAPSFDAAAVNGKHYTNEDLRGKTVVFEWFNPGCPFVKRVYENGYMKSLQKEAVERGVVWLTVNSTNSEHGDFVPSDRVAELMKEWEMTSTNYIVDQDGTIGKLFDVKTTPTIVVIDSNGQIAYSGAVDNYPQISGDESKLELFAKDALVAVSSGRPVARPYVKSYGCSVKYSS